MELDILKGTTDYLPSQQITRARIVDVCRETFELFGFAPAETPILNHWEVLASKYAGGAEILKETYRLSDQGGRDLGLRYDLTVPFARMVGMYQGGRLPAVFKRYEIGKVFRNGPVKTGRLREFTQCDIDVVTPPGVNTAALDAEFIAIADRVFRELGIPAFCQFNDRRFLSATLKSAGVREEQLPDAILAVDKIEKIGVDGVAKEFAERGLDPEAARKFFAAASEAENGGGVPAELVALRSAAVEGLGVTMPLRWNPGLARGLEIYTGTVFEFFWRDPASDTPRPNPAMSSSMAAGGRYDKIIGQFLHPEEPEKQQNYPAAGMSFGLDVLTKVLELLRGEQAGRATVTQLLIFPFGEAELSFAMKAAAELRAAGVRTEVDYSHRKIKNSVEFASKMAIPFHAAVGGNEVKEGKIMLKELSSGEKGLLTPAEAAARIRGPRAGV
jgi:histidyl-tRNA synthetase